MKLDWMKVCVFCVGIGVSGFLVFFDKIPVSTLGLFLGWLLPSPLGATGVADKS